MSLFANLLDHRVEFAEGLIAGQATLLWPEEEPAVANSVHSRRAEFSAGRGLARKAMASIDVAAGPIPAAADRIPIWPDGLVGSITHTATYAAAAVARVSDGIASVGIDLEPHEELERELWPMVLTSNEERWLTSRSDHPHGLLAKLHFSAKECAFKCQYTLSKQMLEFADFEIAFHLDRGRFTACYNRDCPPFRAGDLLHGAFRMASGFIATAMTFDVPPKVDRQN